LKEYRDKVPVLLRGFSARLVKLGIAEAWMLEEGATRESGMTPVNAFFQLFLRDEITTWVAPGIVAIRTANIAELDPDEIWPPKAEYREPGEVERELKSARQALKDTISAAASAAYDSRKAPALELAEPSPGQAGQADHEGRACPTCAEVSDTEGSFCPYCGTRYAPVKTCSKCGEETETDGRFCPHCGSKYEVTEEEPGEPGSDVTDEDDDAQGAVAS
jgi:RNA polymerase subunit RPABC4/transcription elongation factor Spt4